MNANAKYQYRNLRTRAAGFFRALVTVFVLATTLSAPVMASPVSAPTGATLSSVTPILVQWTTSYWPTPTVGVYLYKADPGGSITTGVSPWTLATNIPNNGQTSVNLPNSFMCSPTQLYLVSVGSTDGYYGYNQYSANFKFSCVGGSVTVVKTAVNDSGAPILSGSYLVDVTCGHDGPNATLTLSSANSFQGGLMNIPQGRNCTINEQRPPAALGCRWTTTYPLGKTVNIGGRTASSGSGVSVVDFRLEVHNQLNCLGSGPLTAASAVTGNGVVFEGPLSIVKQVVNTNAGIPTPQGPFQVNLNCDGTIHTVQLTSPSFQQTVNVPNGSSCTINEIAPTPPTGCTWTTTYPNKTGTVGARLVVQNELRCNACKPGQIETDRFPGYCCEGNPGSEKFCCMKKGADTNGLPK